MPCTLFCPHELLSARPCPNPCLNLPFCAHILQSQPSTWLCPRPHLQCDLFQNTAVAVGFARQASSRGGRVSRSDGRSNQRVTFELCGTWMWSGMALRRAPESVFASRSLTTSSLNRLISVDVDSVGGLVKSDCSEAADRVIAECTSIASTISECSAVGLGPTSTRAA